jgi:phosphate transport system permease protein
MTSVGLANAMVWLLFLMVSLATFVGAPIGMLAGIYLAEFDTKGWLATTTRFVNDILLSAPSIVIGLFVYALVVASSRRFQAGLGIIALALIVIPVVIRTTENMLQLMPVRPARGGLRAWARRSGR